MTITWVTTTSGKSYMTKDPQARKRYGLELADVLAESVTTITAAEVTQESGVTADGAPTIFGTKILVFVTGGVADTPWSENYITIKYTLSDTSYDEKTLYFRIKDGLS